MVLTQNASTLFLRFFLALVFFFSIILINASGTFLLLA